jgi:predicted esterase
MGLLKKLTIFITGFILCLSSVAGALESGEFSQSDYEAVLNTIANDDDFEEKFYIEKLQRFHFVFVGGFVNELAKDYFTDNKLSLEAFGAGKVSIVMPSSAHSARDNLAWLQDKVESLFEDGGRLPIILVGHSKGGLESAALIINNTDLVRKKIVSAVVTVQSKICRH